MPALARVTVCLFALLLARPARAAWETPVAPDSLEDRPIRSVTIVPRNIYDPLPDSGVRGIYALINRLHARTRVSTVRGALVLRPRDRWTAARRAEAERRLRGLRFLVPDSLSARPAGDSVDVRVVTRDNWTTSPEISIESGGGQAFGSFSFSERNLAGLGVSVSAATRKDLSGVSHSLFFEDGALAGSHWRLAVAGGSGAAGKSSGLSLGLPFWADDAPTTIGAAWSRVVSESDLYATGQLAARIPRRREDTELLWGTGRRTPDGTIQRFIASFEAIDDRFGAAQLEPSAAAEFASPAAELRVRRGAGEITLWRPRYVVRRGVDYMDRDEDFDLGSTFAFKTGFSPQAFGGTADEAYGRLRAGLGFEAGRAGFAMLRASGESRVRSGLRETYGQAGLRLIVQPFSHVTLVGAGQWQQGRRMPPDFQLTVGSLSGLRAFGVRELSGTTIHRWNGEVRWIAKRDWLQLLSLGGAAFYDAAIARGPGSGNESWHQDLGVGLRLSLPHSALNSVVRFDVAWPTAPHDDKHRGPVYSFGSGQAF